MKTLLLWWKLRGNTEVSLFIISKSTKGLWYRICEAFCNSYVNKALDLLGGQMVFEAQTKYDNCRFCWTRVCSRNKWNSIDDTQSKILKQEYLKRRNLLFFPPTWNSILHPPLLILSQLKLVQFSGVARVWLSRGSYACLHGICYFLSAKTLV